MMTETLTIRRFQARYHLRPSQSDERRRLDRLIPDVTGEALGMALERVGISPGEVVCIRRLSLLIRLHLSRTDSSLVCDWAELLSNAIAAALAEANNAVRYRTRSRALVDMGARIAQLRFELVWAWRQIGFWDESGARTDLATAADQFARAIMREPELAIPVLATLASQGSLNRLARQWDGRVWLQIAAAVLRHAGSAWQAIPSERALPTPAGPQQSQSLQPHQVAALAEVHASRIIERSRILADIPISRLSADARHAAILLTVLEVEPSLLRAAPSKLIEISREVLARVPEPTFPAASHKPESRSESTRREIEQRSPKPSPPVVEPVVSKSELPTHSQETTRADRRPASEYRTAFAGLLFLLRLEDNLGIPERALELSPVAARGLKWFQHRLALALQPLEPDDPAALAFCGLPPQAPPPSLEQPPPSPAEQDFINACAAEMSTALAEALRRPDENSQKLLQVVCLRRAQIVADPGWIEIRLDMGDLSVEIRRAGLDLDPNFIPWLGVVMRFVYD